MRLFLFLIAVGLPVEPLLAQAPVYSSASLVNSADNQSGPLAPNTIATLYGQNLAWGTRTLTAGDLGGGVLPTMLPNTGVLVLVGGLPANPFYVSPTQINFLVPICLQAGTAILEVVVDGLAGPPIPVQIVAAAPALYQMDSQTVVATAASGAVLTASAPAHPGDLVILYATGLGQTAPAAVYGAVPRVAASLLRMPEFTVLLDGVHADPSLIAYAGIAPGFAGLYQVNVTLPAGTGPNPEIRIGYSDALSPAGIHLPVAVPGS